ncbi:hypothetical protein HY003_00020 [Candidatus Saccharibacteria bacterium]|nr:hypothetical protein [Candidatus Saccharibacteria bacterium]MBI3337676.1 hypothetical protein [Candidatus Saccharibacteria bacterium]
MKTVPYHGNPGNACALACYTMVGQYLLPKEHITFEKFGEMADWRKGYVVWAFSIWEWMMEQGVHIDEYDIVDANLWRDGIEGVRKALPAKEFAFYKDNSFDLDKTLEKLPAVLDHPNFKSTKCKVTWKMITEAVQQPGICEVTLNGCKLHRVKGFSVHRVVIIDITDDEVIFHDPTLATEGAYKHESIKHFRSALDGLSGPELTHYYL